jgi:hypothetical protein
VEPLIIKDNREGEPAAAVSDLPSVSHLPDPKEGEGKAPEHASPVLKK